MNFEIITGYEIGTHGQTNPGCNINSFCPTVNTNCPTNNACPTNPGCPANPGCGGGPAANGCPINDPFSS